MYRSMLFGFCLANVMACGMFQQTGSSEWSLSSMLPKSQAAQDAKHQKEMNAYRASVRAADRQIAERNGSEQAQKPARISEAQRQKEIAERAEQERLSREKQEKEIAAVNEAMRIAREASERKAAEDEAEQSRIAYERGLAEAIESRDVVAIWKVVHYGPKGMTARAWEAFDKTLADLHLSSATGWKTPTMPVVLLDAIDDVEDSDLGGLDESVFLLGRQGKWLLVAQASEAPFSVTSIANMRNAVTAIGWLSPKAASVLVDAKQKAADDEDMERLTGIVQELGSDWSPWRVVAEQDTVNYYERHGDYARLYTSKIRLSKLHEYMCDEQRRIGKAMSAADLARLLKLTCQTVPGEYAQEGGSTRTVLTTKQCVAEVGRCR